MVHVEHEYDIFIYGYIQNTKQHKIQDLHLLPAKVKSSHYVQFYNFALNFDASLSQAVLMYI